LVNDDNILRFNVATEISAQLSKFGISTDIKRVPYDDLQKSINTKTYDMAILGYRISSVPDLSFAYSSAQIQTGLNASGYSNPQVDNYLNLILAESDTEMQKSYYTNLLGIIKDDTPFVGLFFLNDSVMYSKNLKGAMNPYIWKTYNNAVQWYMP
jgi:peptide/nickel transport system substrate-binding protein